MVLLHSAVSSFRKEVQDYLHASEQLISTIASGDNLRLSNTERDMVEFCTKELAQLIAPISISHVCKGRERNRTALSM